jgi:hypothetical protein
MGVFFFFFFGLAVGFPQVGIEQAMMKSCMRYEIIIRVGGCLPLYLCAGCVVYTG